MEEARASNLKLSGFQRGSVVVVSSDHRSPWDLIKEQLQKKLSVESFENWIRRTKFAGIEGKTMLATAPDRQTRGFPGRGVRASRSTPLRPVSGLGVERVEFRAESSRMPGIPGSNSR